MLFSAITTIQTPTDSVLKLAAKLSDHQGRLVVAGDSKGPHSYDLSGEKRFDSSCLSFLSLEDQLSSDFSVAKLLPTKHYCRKNIAYLHAMRCGASCIYETDDDNAPLDSWAPRSEHVDGSRTVRHVGNNDPTWVNVYKYFTDELIWPRGLPLDQIHTQHELSEPPDEKPQTVWAPIQQGLADGSPDVDAIWRLVLDREFQFQQSKSVYLSQGQWCPFNTQTTWWWPAAYPLMYVPSYCSFRMCDIWKSFIAQRCLWELDTGIVFHAPEVVQARNVHDLNRDFNDEVPGYQENNRIAEILEQASLKPGVDEVGGNLRRCYESLVENEIFPSKELPLVEAWIADVANSK